MGWGSCGVDELGRPIGYLHEGVCDHPGCTVQIDRGLGHACGEMHGEDENSCSKYFCEGHRVVLVLKDGKAVRVCLMCEARLRESGRLAAEEYDEGEEPLADLDGATKEELIAEVERLRYRAGELAVKAASAEA